jgi:hypothetical protein
VGANLPASFTQDYEIMHVDGTSLKYGLKEMSYVAFYVIPQHTKKKTPTAFKQLYVAQMCLEMNVKRHGYTP